MVSWAWLPEDKGRGRRVCRVLGGRRLPLCNLRGARTVRDWRGITMRIQQGARLSCRSLSFLTCQMGSLTVLISVD